jgi:hypothetical protein
MYKIEEDHPLVEKSALKNKIDEILEDFKSKFEKEYEDSIENYVYMIDIASVEVTGNLKRINEFIEF